MHYQVWETKPSHPTPAPHKTKVSAEAGTLMFMEMSQSEWKLENNPEDVKEDPDNGFIELYYPELQRSSE